RHRRGEQLARTVERCGNTKVDEDYVLAGQHLRIRTEHRMDRGDLAAGVDESLESGAERRLQGADIKDEPARTPRRKRVQHLGSGAKGRREHDEILIERIGVPIRKMFEAFDL